MSNKKGKAYCIPYSDFKRLTHSFFRAKKVAYPLTPSDLTSLLCESGTHSRENSLGLVDLFGIELVEKYQSTSSVQDSDNIWFAGIDKEGNARILYPNGMLIVEDFELDNLQLEHEFGHLLYLAMMDYLGKGRLNPRNEFEEDYAKTFALCLRVGAHLKSSI